MKRLLLTHPEFVGLVLGLSDAVPRALAALAYAPSKASLHGMLLIGNVHHVNGVRAFGFDTTTWFAIGAAALALMYTGLRAGGHALRVDNVAFVLARGLFGAVAGVLLLNVAEALLTGKVTNYFGIAYGARFTAINGGDVLLWLSLAALPPAVAGAFALHLTGRARAA